MENSKQNTGAKIIKMEQPFTIRPYSKTELVRLYRPISMYVLNKWLKEIESETGPIIAATLSIRQMEIFLLRYGLPGQNFYQAAA